MVQVGNPQAVPACLVREQSAWNLFAHNDSKAISQSFRGATRETFLDLDKDERAGTEQRCTFIRKTSSLAGYLLEGEVER